MPPRSISLAPVLAHAVHGWLECSQRIEMILGSCDCFVFQGVGGSAPFDAQHSCSSRERYYSSIRATPLLSPKCQHGTSFDGSWASAGFLRLHSCCSSRYVEKRTLFSVFWQVLCSLPSVRVAVERILTKAAACGKLLLISWGLASESSGMLALPGCFGTILAATTSH